MSLNSLPVGFAIGGANYICAGLLTLTQFGVAAYLSPIGNQQMLQTLWI
jgi:hypothetical protein